MPAAAIPYLIAASVATGVYAVTESSKQASEARSEAKKQALRVEQLRKEEMAVYEKQAGEYYDLTAEEMELQAQYSQIQTLAALIEQSNQPAAPQIITLPAAKEYTAAETINNAIHKVVKGLG